MRPINLQIPTIDEFFNLELKAGGATIIVGANGSGKSRLAALVENSLGEEAHRIPGQRGLDINPHLTKTSELLALNGLRVGWESAEASIAHRESNRWSKWGSISDFDYVLKALFAEQTNVALQTHDKVRRDILEAGVCTTLKSQSKAAKFEILRNIWEQVISHRSLKISGDYIHGVPRDGGQPYGAEHLSDGERAVIYLAGQVLLAAPDSIIIVDEPELHIHRAVLSRLWDQLFAARQDCAFLLITHDLEFAAHVSGTKLIIRSYRPGENPQWEIQEVPKETGFSEEDTTLLLGSRLPILFVEGDGGSLDISLYRACFPSWHVIAKESCSAVIHSVTTFNKNRKITRLQCAGIVDRDDFSEDEKDKMAELGVGILPVAEIENLVLLPEVAKAILEAEHFSPVEVQERLSKLLDDTMSFVQPAAKIEGVVLRYCRRRIDRTVKKIDLSGTGTVALMSESFSSITAQIDIVAIADARRAKIIDAINRRDQRALLEIYDNKGMFSVAASCLSNRKVDQFKDWLVRLLVGSPNSSVKIAVKDLLPNPFDLVGLMATDNNANAD